MTNLPIFALSIESSIPLPLRCSVCRFGMPYRHAGMVPSRYRCRVYVLGMYELCGKMIVRQLVAVLMPSSASDTSCSESQMSSGRLPVRQFETAAKVCSVGILNGSVGMGPEQKKSNKLISSKTNT